MNQPMDHPYDLFKVLNIHITGPSLPEREAPIHCFRPVVRPYYRPDHQTPRDHSLYATLQGGSLRTVDAVDGGDAVVYDRDVSAVWRLPSMMAAYQVYFWEKAFEAAVGQEVMLIAVEAFWAEQKLGTWMVVSDGPGERRGCGEC